jgi:hypothetical protein
VSYLAVARPFSLPRSASATMPIMDQDSLKHAIIALGDEHCAMVDVSDETLHRLAELGLAHWKAPGWTLTPAGQKLLPKLLAGEEVEI